MKRFLLITGIIIVIVVLILAGCSQPAAPPKTSAPASSAPSSASATSSASAKTSAPAPAASAASSGVIQLKIAHGFPPTAPQQKGTIEPWTKKMEELTKGRVKFTIYPAGSLVKMPDLWDAVLTGTADITLIVPALNVGVFPLSDAFTLPMLFDSVEAQAATMYDMYQKYLKDTEYKKVRMLWVLPTAASQVNSKKIQVKTLADLAGLRISVTSENGQQAIKALGGSPTILAPPDVYTSLQTGLVDTTIDSWGAVASEKFYELTKYRTTVNMFSNFGMTVMNLDKWNSLPPDIKTIFEQNTGIELSRSAGAFVWADAVTSLEKIVAYDKQQGNPPIYDLPKDEKAKWVQALAPIRDKWATNMDSKGLPGKAFLNDLMTISAKYNQEIASKK